MPSPPPSRVPAGPPAFPFHLAVRALRIVQPRPGVLAGIGAVALVGTASSVAEPLAIKFALDRLGTAGADRGFAIAAGTLLLLLAARVTATGWVGARTWDVRLAFEYRLRERLSDKLARIPLDVYRREGSGGLLYAMNAAVPETVVAFTETLSKFLPTLSYLAMASWAMMRLDRRLALVVLVLAPFPALVAWIAAREQTRRARTLHHHWKALWARYTEVIAGIGTVRAFGMERHEQDRFLTGQTRGFAIIREGAWADAKSGALSALVEVAARGVVLAWGGWLVAHGQLTLGTLVAFLGYIGGLFGPVQGLVTIYSTVRRSSVALEAIFGVLDCEEEPDAVAGARTAPPLRGAVRFDDVTFAYEPGRPALAGVAFEARPGERIALVGASGSGKSTVFQLIQRLRLPDAGAVIVDGADTRELAPGVLRGQIGVVLQDVHLFNDTVHANIAYARPGATREEVIIAAAAANAHEFIAALPESYDTVIDERGARLSGGQRQRLAIARAFLMSPPVLLLDEATASLDSESEQAVAAAIRRLAAGRTTIIAAHRLATVIDADRIVVLREGRIEAIGQHEELLATCGYYAELVGLQLAGLAPAEHDEVRPAA